MSSVRTYYNEGWKFGQEYVCGVHSKKVNPYQHFAGTSMFEDWEEGFEDYIEFFKQDGKYFIQIDNPININRNKN